MADEADENVSVVRYHRRLDRTPEKQFEKLPDADKKLMSTMRSALESCRNKVEDMKDGLEAKDKAIENERSRRLQAEERLKRYLIDPYGSPDVNSELRDRLPRSNKSDPFEDKPVADCSEDDSQVEEPILAKSRSSKSYSKSVSSPERTSDSKQKKVRRTLNFQTPGRSRSRRTTRNVEEECEGETEENESDDDDEENHHHSKPRSRRTKGRHSSHSAGPSVISPLRYPPYVGGGGGGGGYLPGHYGSPLYIPSSPWSSISSFSMLPSPYGPGEVQTSAPHPGIRLSRSFPLLNGEQVGGGGGGQDANMDAGGLDATNSDLHASAPASHHDGIPSQNAAGEEGENQATGSAAKAAANQKPMMPSELYSHSASSLSSHYGLPSSLGARGDVRESMRPGFPHGGVPFHSVPPLARGLGLAGSFGGLSASPATSSTLLHEEIGRLKEANKQLTEKLSASGQEVDTLKLQILAETPGDGTLDPDSVRKFAELMGEVKVAEKRRQEVMEARVKQAEHDKEQTLQDFEHALLHTRENERGGRRLSMKDLSSASDTDDSDEEEIEEMQPQKKPPAPAPSKNGPEAGRETSLKDALKELERRQQRELQCYREELQVVMEQRDQAVEQVQAEREKHLVQHLRMPGQREQILMAKVTALQRERDRAENSLRQLTEEQDERRLVVSLHKALFPDSALNQNDNDNDPEKVNTTRDKLGPKQPSNDDDKLRETCEKEDNQLLEQLRQANQEKWLLQTRCQELEAVCKQEKEERNKLERLNGVLRKKLIAISTSGQQLEEE